MKAVILIHGPTLAAPISHRRYEKPPPRIDCGKEAEL